MKFQISENNFFIPFFCDPDDDIEFDIRPLLLKGIRKLTNKIMGKLGLKEYENDKSKSN